MTRTDDPIEISLTAVRAKRHNLERECEDAITAAAAPFRERIADLDRAEAALKPLVAVNNGDGPAKASRPPGKKKSRGTGRRRKRSTSTPTAPADAKGGGGGADLGKQNREAILTVVRAAPGATTTEIVEATGLDRSTVTQHLQKLVGSSSGRPALRMEKDPDDGRVRRYYAQEADMAPANDAGVKTGDEQKLVDVLEAADGPLPPGEISIRTGIRSDFVPQMAQKLMQRGVIERVPPKRDGQPPRYQPARKLADAVADAVA